MDDMGDRTTEISANGLQGFFKYVPHALVRQYELDGWTVYKEALEGTHHGHHSTLMFIAWKGDDEDGGSDRAGASAEEHSDALRGPSGALRGGSGDDQD